MDINELTGLIGSVGFPIFMSVVLICFMQKEQRSMSEAIHELKEAIIILTEKIKGDKKNEV